jgi:phosphoenolpyruvate---glycerone phosphotransferase subunit DhaM
MSRVGLVVVSHSARLAEGVVEVAAQMAPEVVVVAAGGTADGGIGTDSEAVAEALTMADNGAGVVVLYDLGSARMVADMAVEALPDPARAVVVDAPLVEATVAAAVAAQGGAALATVANAAREAIASFGDEPVPAAPMPAAPAETASAEPAAQASAAPAERAVPAAAEPSAKPASAEPASAKPISAEPTSAEPASAKPTPAEPTPAKPASAEPASAEPISAESTPADSASAASVRITLTNDVGLHARPAGLLARTLSDVDASVTVQFGGRSADATSVLALMSLGAHRGDAIDVSATGPHADEALRRVTDLAARGFVE